jgi:hypothetical protein
MPEVALVTIDAILLQPDVELLPTPSDLVSRWTELVRRTPVSDAQVFDFQLAATLLANGVRRLYTFNTPDLRNVEGLAVLTP